MADLWAVFYTLEWLFMFFTWAAVLKFLLNCAIAGAFFCRADEFICNNTLCKLHTWVCDGKDDCGDNSDEDIDMCGGCRLSVTEACFWSSWCIFHRPLLPRGNISLSFHKWFYAVIYLFIVSLKDISISFFFRVVCSPAKLPCPPTRPFRCRNDHVCLRTDQVCNKVDDCGDNSDEEECGERKMHQHRSNDALSNVYAKI